MPIGEPAVPIDAIRLDEAARINSRANLIGQKPADYDPARLPENAAVEIKYDGIGLCYVAGAIQTLEGVPMACASHLQRGLDELAGAFGQPMFFQGEYVEAGGFEKALSAFASGRGQGCVFIFDAVPIPAWDGLELSISLRDRRALLEEAFAVAKPGAGVGLAKHAQGFDRERVELAAGAAWEGGEEGIVVKDLDGPFVRAKDPSWMKIKRVLTVDVPVQSIMLGAGGQIEKIIVTYGGKPVAVPHIPSALRRRVDEFWAGRLVEIKHLGETKNGYLKSPVFLRFRDDKGKGKGN